MKNKTKIISKKKENKKNYILIFITRIAVIAAILVIIYSSVILFLKTIIYKTNYLEIVKDIASTNNIDPYLILSLIKTESNFNENALSSKDAKGLMQILDSTAIEINNKLELSKDLKNDIYIPKINISIGTKYFSNLITKYNGNYYLAICAYNGGMGNVDKWINSNIITKDLDRYTEIKIPFEETKKYLSKVITSYKMYKFLYK